MVKIRILLIAVKIASQQSHSDFFGSYMFFFFCTGAFTKILCRKFLHGPWFVKIFAKIGTYNRMQKEILTASLICAFTCMYVWYLPSDFLNLWLQSELSSNTGIAAIQWWFLFVFIASFIFNNLRIWSRIVMVVSFVFVASYVFGKL